MRVLPLAALAAMVSCEVAPSNQVDAGSPSDAGSVVAAGGAPAGGSADLPIFGFGHAATDEEIQAWDIDAMPDGRGLPPGSGTVAEGELVYAAWCVACHGATGTEGPYDRLVGPSLSEGARFGSGRSVGNYWPYATTLFDYVRRAMPYDVPGTLTPDEVYAVSAYVLHMNGIVPEDAVMDAETLAAVVMPARDRFVVDDREDGPIVR